MNFNETIQTVQKPPVGLLKCKECGELKAPTEFYMSRSNKSGRMSMCKKCWLAQAKVRRANDGGKDSEPSDDGQARQAGAYANEQVTSIVRELAFLEYKNSQAHADAKARIEAVEAEKNKTIDDIASHVTCLQQELKKACAQIRKDGKPVVQCCIYGTVCYTNGELTMTLYPAFAWANRGKP